MFHYKTLENTDTKTLHKAFISAFSDYQVKTDLPLSKFQQMLQRRGYTPEISIGTFENDNLVGFVLNGYRTWNEKPTVYDTGTGVIAEYRKQGITSNMLSNIQSLLKEKGVQQYLLEVIQSNTPAVQLYKKQGFEITRNLDCFQLNKKVYNPITTCKVEHIDTITSNDWKELANFWEFTPSWQNSIDSVNAAQDTFIYSIIRSGDAIIGYGIIDKKTGDIPQIAVNKNHTGKGIARSIITDLLKNTESDTIRVINVDGKAESMKKFLQKLGFEYIISQYEMLSQI